MDYSVLIAVEEYLNTHFQPKKQSYCFGNVPFKYTGAQSDENDLDPDMKKRIDDRLKNYEPKRKLYDVVVAYAEKLDNGRFLKKSGKLNESQFYSYAQIDDSTWSNLRLGIKKPAKKTLLKLAIALELDVDQAADLMQLGGTGFDYTDMQEKLIIALLDMKIYKSDTVYGVLECYRQDYPFDNIYDTREDIREKKEKEKKEKEEKNKQKGSNK